MRRAKPRRGGYMLIDVALGLALMAGLLVLVTAGWSQYRRGSAELAATREAVRVAEDVIAGRRRAMRRTRGSARRRRSGW